MKIFDQFEIIEPYPALYIDKIKAVVISDLHLGLESLLTRSGFLFPRFQLKEIVNDLEKIFEKKKADVLIINGDIKHEFSEISWQERKEILDFLDFLTSKVKKVLLVKGNHDNYVIYAVKNYPEIELDDYFILGNICFMHGHQKELSEEMLKADYFIIGNEHPIISLKDELGVKEKIPCFLYGKMRNGKRITVMPAFSKLSQGSELDKLTEGEIMSPVLRKEVDLKKMRAIGISKELGVMNFPEIEKFL